MEIVEQIKEICTETDNEWFLEHTFTKIALSDLRLDEIFKGINIMTFNDIDCTCSIEPHQGECIRCKVEYNRDYEIEKLGVRKCWNNVYDYDTEYYIKSKWIIADRIEGKIPGFMLVKCTGDDIEGDFTHTIYFACVRPEYRKKGILKSMVNQLPKNWSIWLEASSCQTENIEDIWEKCGFQIHEYNIINKKIYKNLPAF